MGFNDGIRPLKEESMKKVALRLFFVATLMFLSGCYDPDVERDHTIESIDKIQTADEFIEELERRVDKAEKIAVHPKESCIETIDAIASALIYSQVLYLIYSDNVLKRDFPNEKWLYVDRSHVAKALTRIMGQKGEKLTTEQAARIGKLNQRVEGLEKPLNEAQVELHKALDKPPQK